MALTNPGSISGDGASVNPEVLKQIVKELQGLKCVVVAGAVNGTKMNVAALRKEDTLVAVLGVLDAAGSSNAAADDTANVTISETRATGTLTISGNPVAAETFVVNGVTYTFRAAGTLTNDRDILITPGDNTAMAAAVAAAVNAYENRRLSAGNWNTPAVVASSNAGVVTFTSVVDGPGNAPNVVGSDGDLTVATNLTASVTVTASAVDNDDTLTVNGVVFTAKASPAGDVQFQTINGDNTAQALAIAQKLNAYEAKFGTLGITASAAAAVVTIVPNRPNEGNIITLTENATNVAVSGSGTLANGTATGGFTSTTNNTGKTMTVWFFDKR